MRLESRRGLAEIHSPIPFRDGDGINAEEVGGANDGAQVTWIQLGSAVLDCEVQLMSRSGDILHHPA